MRGGLAFVLGGIYSLAFAPFHWLAWAVVAWGGLYLLVADEVSSRVIFGRGWLFGLGHFSGGLYWISLSFFVDWQRTGWLGVPGVVGLAAYLALYMGAAAWCWHRITKGVMGLGSLFLWAGLVIVFEYGRGVVFTGFPWNTTAAVWGDSLEILQWLAHSGTAGLGVMSLVAWMPVALFARHPHGKHATLYAAVPLVLPLMYAWAGNHRLASEGHHHPIASDAQVLLVQPHIRQEDKWRRELASDHMERVRAMVASQVGDSPAWVILPEAALSYDIYDSREARRYLTSMLPENSYMVVGTLAAQERHNMLLVLNETGEIVGAYRKNHLVPFGEYMPLQDHLPFLQRLLPTIASTKAGETGMTLPPHTLPPFHPLICYEVIFPLSDNEKARWIINITNDAWFGNSTGPWQHAVHARMRAIEASLPLVRVANTGISFVSDGFGRISHAIPLGTRAARTVAVPLH